MADLLIDGRWVPSVTGRTREIRCPADGSLVAVVDEASSDDTVAAIGAARRAFDEGPFLHSSVDRQQDARALVDELNEVAITRDNDAAIGALRHDTADDIVGLVFGHAPPGESHRVQQVGNRLGLRPERLRLRLAA